MTETKIEMLERLFVDVTGWEQVIGDLWRGHMPYPPNCWRYVLLRDDRYATSPVTYEFAEDAIGATEFISDQLDAEIRHLNAAE